MIFRYRGVSIGLLLLLVVSGCLADPQRQQTSDLLDQLTQVRQQLGAQATWAQACPGVGDVETRLNGEPGLMAVQPAWSELADAAHALQAVCGQTRLLERPHLDTLPSQAARARWQQGIQHEMGVACDHLRAAASALNRSAPC